MQQPSSQIDLFGENNSVDNDLDILSNIDDWKFEDRLYRKNSRQCRLFYI